MQFEMNKISQKTLYKIITLVLFVAVMYSFFALMIKLIFFPADMMIKKILYSAPQLVRFKKLITILIDILYAAFFVILMLAVKMITKIRKVSNVWTEAKAAFNQYKQSNI